MVQKSALYILFKETEDLSMELWEASGTVDFLQVLLLKVPLGIQPNS